MRIKTFIPWLSMPKRSPDRDIDEYCAKRLRLHPPDRLSSLSDELILRTLSYLPVSELLICERCAYLAFDGKMANREDFLIV